MSKNVEVTMIEELSLNAIRRIVAEEIRRYAEEQAAAKAARPKARVELTAEEAKQYLTVDEVSAVTGYGVPSLRSMAAKKIAPKAFPILPERVGVRSLYNREAVMASPKAQQHAGQTNGFIATPKNVESLEVKTIDVKDAGAIGATIQNAISAAVNKPAAKKAASVKPAAKKAAPAAKKATAAKKVPAKR
ncbi:hypothetical protein P9281_27345 [Caballeronia sp. LP003]|uniref:hypothetical protein n=1 Tax=Caballeronia sp. LP003 TaxID=3038551 RepID=UPI002862CD45|nr:hypothetical protein [Caballeronia sp. LP003]MDR5790265.1 hypothetical protein [Caballeronia sp. LP003]